MIEPLAGMIMNSEGGGGENVWELAAVRLRQLAPTSAGVVLDEMVLAIRSFM